VAYLAISTEGSSFFNNINDVIEKQLFKMTSRQPSEFHFLIVGSDGGPRSRVGGTLPTVGSTVRSTPPIYPATTAGGVTAATYRLGPGRRAAFVATRSSAPQAVSTESVCVQLP